LHLSKTYCAEILPEDAERYIAIIDSSMAANKDQMILALAKMLEEAVTDNGVLKPEFKAFAPQLEQVKQTVAGILQQSQQQNKMPQQGPQGAGQPPMQQQGQMNMQQNNMMSSMMGGSAK
jgi:hypothetical protein